MHDEVNQKISWLVDDELGYGETLELLKKIQSDEGLKNKMSRYHAISQALKTDKFYQVRSDFSHKVFQDIQQEPAHFLPKLKLQSNSQNRQATRNKLFAVAASMLVAAVLVGQGLRNDQPANTYQALATMAAISQQPMPAAFKNHQPSKQNTRQPLNGQFNDYLQAHNSSVYTNGEAHFQPYAKVTAYGQE